MTENRKIIGIDPGKTIGLCLYKNDEFIKGQEAKTYSGIINFIEMNKPDHVVVEDFIISSRPSQAKTPVKQIGAIEYFCEEKSIPLTIQSPSCQKFGNLRTQGIHKSAHVRSACCHVIYYIAKQQQQQKVEAREIK